ncbi:hypothetical protein PM082_021273 [Marasmius tenuissimus]|nr:hypothetical protein PM082_021273 [Marasmius tenuissimus]
MKSGYIIGITGPGLTGSAAHISVHPMFSLLVVGTKKCKAQSVYKRRLTNRETGWATETTC